MRIALISDIHGNMVFFDAVLADIEREAVDQTIFLGDFGTFGPQPKEVIDRLRALDCLCIMGNHDTNVLDLEYARRALAGDPHIIRATEWCESQITADDLAFLSTFKATATLLLDNGMEMLLFHGSPSSNTAIIRDVTPEEELNGHFASYDAPLLIGGHTHLQMLRQYNGRLIVNPGSVGMPLAAMPPVPGNVRMLPWAEYAILDTDAFRLSVDLRRVDTDVEAVKAIALDRAMYDAHNWVTMWVGPG